MNRPPARSGFTLVETMVAITVLTTAIVGPFFAVQTAITAGYVARDELVATMLAQEGIEYARSVRDGNLLYNVANPSLARSWLYGLDGSGGSVNCVDGDPADSIPLRCVVDPTASPSVAQCASGGTGACPALNMSATNLYTQSQPSGYVATRFTRALTMTTVSATEMQVSVTVSWTTNHQPYSLTMKEILQNWL